MALSQVQLGKEFETLIPTIDVEVAKTRFAEAYGKYFKDAVAGVVDVVDGAVDSIAVPALKGALVFAAGSTTTTLSTDISLAILDFWLSIATTPTVFFPGASALVLPPTLLALSGPLKTKFDLNLSSEASLIDAASNIASVIHPASAGGTVVIATVVTTIL